MCQARSLIPEYMNVIVWVAPLLRETLVSLTVAIRSTGNPLSYPTISILSQGYLERYFRLSGNRISMEAPYLSSPLRNIMSMATDVVSLVRTLV